MSGKWWIWCSGLESLAPEFMLLTSRLYHVWRAEEMGHQDYSAFRFWLLPGEELVISNEAAHLNSNILIIRDKSNFSIWSCSISSELF